MTIHPISILDQVIDDYKDYLRSEFRAKDPDLKTALERELDRPLFLAQEPFYQAHRPFKPGKRWVELPLDAKLARAMDTRAGGMPSYGHQSGAIEELLSPSPRPVVVTTGTGSGKSEAFLLPVIQNAIRDAATFDRAGLTAILVYPMNALANDQLTRIQTYLADAGFDDRVTVGQYDRGTPQAQRELWRQGPPHILLTNYMMLEYLLVRPADREGIFANHRCRYLVLDEVHSYRGALGANIALLVRRLRGHLGRARQDWRVEVTDTERAFRYPPLVPVGTSATIKSVSEEGRSREEARELRDEAVRDFFSRLVGTGAPSVQIFSEEIEEIAIPAEAAYPSSPARVGPFDSTDPAALLAAVRLLSGVPTAPSLDAAVSRCRLLWDLNRWLARQPMSIPQLVAKMRAAVPERRSADAEAMEEEVEAALAAGSALPDSMGGGLRLRGHRFIRGGWRFHRCINPVCGRLYPMGEERCGCGAKTAPLYLCRSCGAHYLRFVGDTEAGNLRPSAVESEEFEWMLYDQARFEPMAVDEDIEAQLDDSTPAAPRGRRRAPTQIRNRPVLHGSFDPNALAFSSQAADYAMQVTLSPARTQCLCCGGMAGSRNVITPIALGTSAALKVLAEALIESLDKAKQGVANADDKERLLIFSDSRQDAAHQARFIAFASRYDRMRRIVLRLLEEHGSLTIKRLVELLGDVAVREQDNPFAATLAPNAWVPDETLARIRAWEEAPVLDDVAVTAGYRGTLLNLGLVGIAYHRLDEYVRARGGSLAARLGVSGEMLTYILRCLLDEMRVRGSFSRDMLRYHIAHPSTPEEFKSAEWERRVKQPKGYACTREGAPVPYLDDDATVPAGIKSQNSWRRPGRGGRGPSLQRILGHLLLRLGGAEADEHAMRAILEFLVGDGSYIKRVELFGARDRRTLLQVNAEVVQLVLLKEEDRCRCDVCSTPRPLASVGWPCPVCHGALTRWSDAMVAQNRTVRRLRMRRFVGLVAKEHTAQVPTLVRQVIEEQFKASITVSKLNVLACSPTLEMGIDVGGLDAIALRNIPPRPDNYAQRGGRAGRRSRVGLVIGYARNAPHDQYFYDHPAEMISGEVAAPALALGNRDVIQRHINAMAFGEATPGLAGRMREYVTPTGDLETTKIEELIAGLQARFEPAVAQAIAAFGSDILGPAGITEEGLRVGIGRLPAQVRDVFDRTARQVLELRRSLDAYAAELVGPQAATRAGNLVARLLGVPTDANRGGAESDDRSAGYPLRRFAEFGILPGYEFPTAPATLRLLGDPNEDDPISVGRRFGIGQFQPNATVYARGRRWRVIGLDVSSPWNPRADGPSWSYRLCHGCGLRFAHDHPACPRCGNSQPGGALPAYEFAGFLAKRDEAPVMDEEERFAVRNLVRGHPQWDGEVFGRWEVGGGWSLRLSRGEQVQWLNEGPPPANGDPTVLHQDARGYLLCSLCGRNLKVPPPIPHTGGRRAPGKAHGADPYEHSPACPMRGQPPRPHAIVAPGTAEILRLVVPVPPGTTPDEVTSWGLTLGFTLRTGMRHLFMLDGSEIEFVLEGPWEQVEGDDTLPRLSLTFIDPSIGGTGYLHKVAEQFHLVAQHAFLHLDHDGCETACYRCLKSYANQRYHDQLRWPLAVPHLEALRESPAAARALETGDIENPKPWLEAFAAGVGSPLELKFLRLFERHGFKPEPQVPIAPRAGEPAISIADFAVPDRRLAIYIDGAAFHRGIALRRDRKLREALRNGDPPWRVVELRSADLARGEQLVNELRSLG